MLLRTRRAVIAVGQENQRPEGSHFERVGSGVAVGPRTILTVAHVVGHVSRVAVEIEGKTVAATVDAIDRPRDIAVLKLAADACRDTLPLGNSDKLQLGEPLFSIGFSAGKSAVVSSGIFAGRFESDAPDEPDGILTDAAMSRGSSGGALVKQSGELVGLNDVANVSFGVNRAVPIELVKPLLHNP